MNLDTYLSHYGIKNMKWGIRRFQYKDGSLTPAGKKRYAKLRDELAKLESGKKSSSSETSEKKSKKSSSTPLSKVRQMNDTDLNRAINRMNNEQRYLNLQKDLSKFDKATLSKGQKVIQHINKNIILPTLDEAGKALLRQSFNKLLKINVSPPQDKKKKKAG